MSRTGVSHRAPLLDAGSTRYLATTGSSSGSWHVSRWSGLYRWLAPPACPGECVRPHWAVLRRLGCLGSASSSGSNIAYIVRLVNRSRKTFFSPARWCNRPLHAHFRDRAPRGPKKSVATVCREVGGGGPGAIGGRWVAVIYYGGDSTHLAAPARTPPTSGRAERGGD